MIIEPEINKWYNAIVKLDMRKIKDCILSGVDVNCVFGKVPFANVANDIPTGRTITNNNTALLELCSYTTIKRDLYKKSLLVVKLIVKKYGADVNLCSLDGIHPLYRAALNRRRDIVVFLVENGANIDYVSPTGKHVLDFIEEPCLNNLSFKESIIKLQPWNIKLFDDRVGFLPELKVKYEDAFYISDLAI